MFDMTDSMLILKRNPIMVSEIGDCPNMELPTLGGEVFWDDIDNEYGWRLQYNKVTKHARIIDDKNIRRAWGILNVMQEKFKRLTREEFLEPGDVIGVARSKSFNIYEHYAVYIGNGKVVHYSGEGSDFNSNINIREDSFDDFLKQDKDYFVLFFNEENRIPHKIQPRTNFNMSDVNYESYLEIKKDKNFKIYSPEETVQRALSKIGEDKYHLVFNNCEHFAIWCKTGVSESYQVKRVLKGLIKGVL